ncbi:hypothetical protein [Actinomyces ruminis]|uniref:hypothetical protein n=1 Tax=Actinomyces ruminis TaxID=1937003 RepID=UPI00211EF1C8|nr:hypothetical protein [Actinomyces ruminis]
MAAAPATAALIVLGLIALAVCVRRSALRLLLALAPVAATAAPAWWRAARLARAVTRATPCATCSPTPACPSPLRRPAPSKPSWACLKTSSP